MRPIAAAPASPRAHDVFLEVRRPRQSSAIQLRMELLQRDIAITATHLMMPMSESRGDMRMLDQVDR